MSRGSIFYCNHLVSLAWTFLCIQNGIYESKAWLSVCGKVLLRNECFYFLGSLRMNGSTERIYKSPENCSDSFSVTPEKDIHSLYLQCFHQRPFLKYSNKIYQFKFPAVTGTLPYFMLITRHVICPTAELLVGCVFIWNKKLLHGSTRK